ncbi:MAG: 30S ribosomal protein S4 [Anaerolineae bacterium]|nr:30S ribosomal protein S4 [Anaerolineae bacterium]
MASYHGPKAKVQRRFGEVLAPRPKYVRILDKRAYPPGDHGKEKQFRSGRRSDYGLQLNEKQKIAFIYNVREGQLRRYFMRARQMPGNTGANLLALLERRLDNLVYRAGFAVTIWQARQMVSHGHILVNGTRLNIPSYQVSPGESISLVEKMRKNPQVVESLDSTAYAPAFLSVDTGTLTATLTRIPERGEIQVPVDEQLVVEFYNRLA